MQGFHQCVAFATGADVWHYKRLEVWKRARTLVAAIYADTEAMPKSERFGLTSQMRRSANSIGANIAEGAGRGSPAEVARFLGYAMGSTNETEHHLFVARDVGMMNRQATAALLGQVNELRRMLHALRRQLIETGPKPNARPESDGYNS
jgi:four helix bundle protein